MQLYGLEHLHLMRDPITGTKCLIAWGEGHIVISFRGTANVRNARHDAKVSCLLNLLLQLLSNDYTPASNQSEIAKFCKSPQVC